MDNMPTDRPQDFLGRPVARVSVDNIWATPSTLHMRVTVWNATYRYRHKYEIAVPVAEIPEDAISALWTANVEEKWDPETEDVPLF